MTWAIYQRQDSMFQPGAQEQDILRDIAKTVGGLSKAAFDACIADKQALAAVNARSERHLNVDKVEFDADLLRQRPRLEDELAPGDLAKAVHAATQGRRTSPATGGRGAQRCISSASACRASSPSSSRPTSASSRA